jgi:hypothetical protein
LGAQLGGLKHEDWQYTDFQEKAFWPVSLLAFISSRWRSSSAGCLPLSAGHAFRPLDVLGAFLTIPAVLIEWGADEQLRRSRRSGADGFCNVVPSPELRR